MYEELLEKLPATFLDAEKIGEFAMVMQSRTSQGKKEYPETYRFDPLVEAQQECVDIAVYAMIEYYRIDKLRRELSELESKRSKG